MEKGTSYNQICVNLRNISTAVTSLSAQNFLFSTDHTNKEIKWMFQPTEWKRSSLVALRIQNWVQNVFQALADSKSIRVKSKNTLTWTLGPPIYLTWFVPWQVT